MLYYAAISCLVITFCTVDSQNNSDVQDKNKEPNLRDYDWDVKCKFQPNGYECGKVSSRFYYDIKMEDCKTFSYGGCPTNINNFGSITSCHEICSDVGQHAIKQNYSDKVICRLQPDFGQCDDYHPMWYFDIKERACRGFSYSGCGGNHNRFSNPQLCTAVCTGVVEF